MAWTTLTDLEVIEEFNPQELTALNTIKGRNDLGAIVERVVSRVRAAVMSGNYPIGEPGTIPEGLKDGAIAMARWKFLISVPKNDALQTKDRRDANDKFEELLDKIAAMDFAPEEPVPSGQGRGGNWNSENKLIMRTHPTPKPSTQSQSTTQSSPPYANPNAPADT